MAFLFIFWNANMCLCAMVSLFVIGHVLDSLHSHRFQWCTFERLCKNMGTNVTVFACFPWCIAKQHVYKLQSLLSFYLFTVPLQPPTSLNSDTSLKGMYYLLRQNSSFSLWKMKDAVDSEDFGCWMLFSFAT